MAFAFGGHFLTGAVSIMLGAVALAAPQTPRPTRCDGGVLRWADDGREVALFGVNYYAPFAIDYQALQRRSLDPAAALRTDLVHLRRLGLDALRLHCWDREISDSEGNLVDNDHLRLLDLLIAEAANQGLYTVLTPIAWWGTSAPDAKGFSTRFTMPEMTTTAAARACQVRYLEQFVAHTNRVTGRRYADDPRIIAIEVINEPLYPPGTADDAVIEYINALAAAVRRTGCTKPVLYNCWAGREAAAARAALDGVTFGWYPTGLVAGRALTDNRLPSVDRHHNAHTPCLDKLLKVVYEFDAADVQGSYMYPAMAREFRGAGIQVATQFQYDAVALAGTNENWQTHHLNLLYTPGKALSFAIAAEAFRRMPRLTAFPKYPQNTHFAEVRVSFEEDLSELVSDTDLLTSNRTATLPPKPAALRRVWGVGTSPIVSYAGTGAYFLDRVGEGLWRLQVYPDAVVLADPYSGGATEKVRLLWGRHPLTVRLPDLGATYLCRAEATGASQTAAAATVNLLPGAYLLARDATVAAAEIPPDPVPFAVPAPAVAPLAARLDAPDLWREGRALPVTVTVAAAAVASCTLGFQGQADAAVRFLPMAPAGPYRYRAEVPADWLRAGESHCVADVRMDEGVFRFPGGAPPASGATAEPWSLLAVDASTPLPKPSGSGWLRGQPVLRVVEGPAPERSALHLEADGFGEAPACVGMRLDVASPGGRSRGLNTLALTLRGGPATPRVEISLVQDDGAGFGANVQISGLWRTVRVPISSLKPMWGTQARELDLARVRHVTVIFGAWLFPEVREQTHWVEIAAANLEQRPEGVPVRILAASAPVLIATPARQHVRPHGHPSGVAVVPGPTEAADALRVAVNRFGPAPDCTSFRLPVVTSERDALAAVPPSAEVQIPLRAGAQATDAVEIVLVEQDGTPWGTELPLTDEWVTHRLSATDLRFFAHWPHPDGRGGPGDRVQLHRLSSIGVCFGAWLYGEKADAPHAIEIGEISVGKAP